MSQLVSLFSAKNDLKAGLWFACTTFQNKVSPFFVSVKNNHINHALLVLDLCTGFNVFYNDLTNYMYGLRWLDTTMYV